MDMEKLSYKLVYAGLIVLAIGVFTSVTFSSLAHILLLIPGVYFFSHWLKHRDFKPKKSVFALGALILICWLSVISNWNEMDKPLKNIFKTKYFLISFLSYFSIHYAKKEFLNMDRKKTIFALFIAATSIATLSGLIGLFTGFNPLKFKEACHPTRSCGLYGMYMTYGYGMSLFMVLMTGIVLYRDKAKEYLNVKWLVVGWVINLIGLITSLARGAWVGYLAAVPFFFFKKNKKVFLATFLLGVIGLGTAISVNDKASEMFLKRGTSNGQRMLYWRTAITAAYEKPLLGWGYKNFEANMKKIKAKYFIHRPYDGGHAHNNFLEHLASTGILGFLAFSCFVFLWLYESYKYNPLVFPFVLSFLVSGMTQYTFGDGENLFLILAIFSLV